MSSVFQERRQKLSKMAGVVFVVALIFCLLNLKVNSQELVEGYFWGFLFAISIPLGALAMWIVHTLTGGKWGEALKKYYMSVAWTLPFIFLIGLPLYFSAPRLYEWMHLPATDLGNKCAYLNMPFFTLRAVLYFGIWTGITFWLTRIHPRINLSGLFALLYMLAGTFAAIDWLMALDHHWFSTMFGLFYIICQVLLSFCWLVLLFIIFEDHPGDSEDTYRLHSMGNLVLCMVMLTSYTALGQFLIIWMANLPEDIRYFLPRIRNGWKLITGLLIACHFFIPFLMLLRRAWKMNPMTLLRIISFIIIVRIVHIGWEIFPSLGKPLTGVTFTHFGAFLLVASLYFMILFRRLKVTV